MKTKDGMEEIKALIEILVELKCRSGYQFTSRKAAPALEPVIDIIWDGLTDSQQEEIANFEWNLEQENGLNQPQWKPGLPWRRMTMPFAGGDS